jgi:hypothetical protein
MINRYIIQQNEPVPVTKVAIVGTHNFRLQCFFTKMFYDNNEESSYTNLKFKNCAMIRCYNGGQKTIIFEMIYEGELSDDERKHDRKYWKKEAFNRDKNNVPLHFIKDKSLPPGTEIILIRHGKGIHNGVSLLTKMLDPKKYIDAELNDEGITQAENAAYNILDRYKIGKIEIVFGASHLKRSQQTIAIIMKVLSHTKSPIVIVPCTHELLYTSDGNCDGAIKQIGLTPENTPLCNYKKLQGATFPEPCNMVDGVAVDWTKYLAFYKPEKGERGRCRTTNMIDQIKNCLL